MNQEVPLIGLAAVPIITALLQAIKSALPGDRFNRFVPGVAIVCGVGWNLIASASVGDGVTGTAALMGVVIGLAASGLYSQTKTVVAGQ